MLLLPWLCAACGSGAREAANNAPAQVVTTPKLSSEAISDDATQSKGTGKFNEYGFDYRREGGRVTATFRPALPRRDSAVVGAAREVIRGAFGETLEGFPRPVEWEYEGRAVQAIKLSGAEADYVFWPERDEAGAFPRVLFWRVAKGTAE